MTQEGGSDRADGEKDERKPERAETSEKSGEKRAGRILPEKQSETSERTRRAERLSQGKTGIKKDRPERAA